MKVEKVKIKDPSSKVQNQIKFSTAKEKRVNRGSLAAAGRRKADVDLEEMQLNQNSIEAIEKLNNAYV